MSIVVFRFFPVEGFKPQSPWANPPVPDEKAKPETPIITDKMIVAAAKAIYALDPLYAEFGCPCGSCPPKFEATPMPWEDVVSAGEDEPYIVAARAALFHGLKEFVQ